MSRRPWTERDIEDRVRGTLEIMASRGYNPSTEHLASRLLGGRADVTEVEEAIDLAKSVDVRDGLAFIEGSSYIDMCKLRLEANSHHQPLYRGIAEAYTRELVAACPWVKCVMLVGSVATGGLCPGDDLDLNLVVEDGRKYSTHVIGSLLNRKYSFRFRKALAMEREGHYLFPMVVCLNIIWEESQVHPLARRDEQVAYELYSAEVLHGQEYYEGVLADNEWMREYFPQMYEDLDVPSPIDTTSGYDGDGLFERVSRRGLFAFERVIRMYLSRRGHDLRMMDHYDRLKHPYGLYHRPGEEEAIYLETGGHSGPRG